VGVRGTGKWQQISWDEALDSTAKAFTRAKVAHGAQSVAMMHGAARGFRDSYLARLANVFGTPNVSWQGHVCAVPGMQASIITCGPTIASEKSPPACIVVWGHNVAEAGSLSSYQRLLISKDSGAKLIVIDPRGIGLTHKADLWLRVRPGSDLALALGVINVIINKNLYSRAFVDNWTVGFDELKVHIQDYTPEKVAEITWIDAGIIEQVASLIAGDNPVRFMSGNGLDTNINSFQTHRAILILRAITGNIGVPSEKPESAPLPLMRRKSPELELWNKLPAWEWEQRVGAELKLLPSVRYVVPESIMRAVIEEKPYPIRVVYMHSCNSLLTHSNTQYTYKALNKLDFLAVSDMFMSPTAALADIVLPTSSFLEHDDIIPGNPIRAQQKVAQIGECRSDYEILSGLARKLGLGEYFWDTEEQCLDAILQRTRVTFKQLKECGAIPGIQPAGKRTENGFETPSRKVEIYSSQLKRLGFDPLPVYYEPPETLYSNPELAKKYPLVVTSWKPRAYLHSQLRQIARLRHAHPDPIIYIHPETADSLGIKEGDWVYIETKRGKIKQKATFSNDLDTRVVVADYGWWLPEKGPAELYGWAESNINILTNNDPPYNREVGSTNLRGILCRVYKA